jgi:hypothetical protein
MALIACPECGAGVSSSAQACPACAFPIDRAAPGSSSGGRTAQSTWDLAKSIFARVILGGVLFASGAAWEAPPVIISSLVVFGSCLPLWIKARRAARLPAGGGDTRLLEVRLEEYVADAQEREMRMADLAEENSRRIGQMEERIDFAERLVARQGNGEAVAEEQALKQLPPQHFHAPAARR